MLDRQIPATELRPGLVKTSPSKTLMFGELWCMQLLPASVNRSVPECHVAAAWELDGLPVIVRIYLELFVLQILLYMRVFLPEARRNLDVALVPFV